MPHCMRKHDVTNKTGTSRKHIHELQSRIEPRPEVTCTENFMKFGHVVSEICERTDRQTDTLTAILLPLPGGVVMQKNICIIEFLMLIEPS